MATINASNPTLLDIMKATDPNGSIARVIEAMSKKNGLIKDATWREANQATGHVISSRTALPSVAARLFNQGVAASKSRRDQVTESIAMVEGRSQVDAKLANLNGNAAAYRFSEDQGFVQAMNNELERLAFYGSPAAAPEELQGLSPRLDATTKAFGQQIVLCDATASGATQSSMWLLCWGENGVYLVYPRGSNSGGLRVKDMGEQMVLDANNNRYLAYETLFNWDAGMVVEDGRQLVRIANIDAANMAAGTTVLIEAAITAYHQINDPSLGRLAWYANRKVLTFLHQQALNKVSHSTLSIEADIAGGGPIVSLLGIPIRRCDQLLATEAVVS